MEVCITVDTGHGKCVYGCVCIVEGEGWGEGGGITEGITDPVECFGKGGSNRGPRGAQARLNFTG